MKMISENFTEGECIVEPFMKRSCKIHLFDFGK